VLGLAGLALLWLSVHVWRDDPAAQRTVLLSALILLGVTVLQRTLHDGRAQPLASDVRLRWLAVAAIPVYLLGMYWPPAADFFRLKPLALPQWGRLLVVVMLAYGLCRLTDWGARRRHASAGLWHGNC
jgi:hypothetical protein